MLVIRQVGPHGLGAVAGLLVGDRIHRINGNTVRDAIDFQFLTAERDLELEVEREGQSYSLEIVREAGEEWSLQFEDIPIRECANHCVFCFVDQMPRHLRPSLYLRDDDFRLSFLHGSYITLTNLSPSDIERIVTQRLSPLYVSVHSTEPAVRRRLMGTRGSGADILAKIRRLIAGGIEMHTQIVLCPGWNDGLHLHRTVADLADLHPGVRSIALVPVGLTRFRAGLPPLRPVSDAEAVEWVDFVHERAALFRRERGTGLVYCADELYVQSGRPIPCAEEYDGFPQLENGVGMTRRVLDAWEADRLSVRRVTPGEGKIGLVTGELAAVFLQDIVAELNSRTSLDVELIVVHNRFFGPRVTVSGLLTGNDVIDAVSPRRDHIHTLLLPPNCVSADGLMLDDLTPADVAERLEIEVQVGDYDIVRTLLAAREPMDTGKSGESAGPLRRSPMSSMPDPGS